VSETWAVTAALLTSASAAVAAALQSRSATDAREPRVGPTGGLLRFARRQLSRPLWWCALLVQMAGFAFHATALNAGALTLVQPLMASAVVLALPLNHFLDKTAVTAGELAWAGLFAVGLAGFLLTAAPGAPLPDADSRSGAGVAAAVGVILIVVCIVVARRSRPVRAAALLGAAASTAFAAEAALLQVAARTALANPSALSTSTSVYGLVLAGVAGVSLTQLAYRAGPMSAALPAILTVNPLFSVVYGVAVQHEAFRHSAGALIFEIVCFSLLCTAAIALSRNGAGR
jgi:hypothetical protein